MTSRTIKKCDVCGKEEENPQAGSPWATLSLSTGWYGKHPYFTGPYANQNDSPSRSDDICSAECALKWLRTRIERIEQRVKEWAAWNAGAPEREAAQRRLDDSIRKRNEEEDAERRRKALASKPVVPELPAK
jgi:hypothetical protein